MGLRLGHTPHIQWNAILRWLCSEWCNQISVLIAVHWCSLSPCMPSPIIYIQWFLMNICLCNFTLIHYFNFDTFFGAGVHQFVMILNKPTPCCCGLWIISVVSVGYLDISLLVCNHLMTFSPALATFMLWRIVQINMAKLKQVYAKMTDEEKLKTNERRNQK